MTPPSRTLNRPPLSTILGLVAVALVLTGVVASLPHARPVQGLYSAPAAPTVTVTVTETPGPTGEQAQPAPTVNRYVPVPIPLPRIGDGYCRICHPFRRHHWF